MTTNNYPTNVAVLSPKPTKHFIETSFISSVTERALRYVGAGYPIHLCGPTGCGKTTLALHISSKVGRPVVLINGDEEFRSSSLVGGSMGYRWHKTVDNYVSRVYKSEESMSKQWVDERLTLAVKHGLTLVYNEFTRSRPEANNVLLSVFEEGILDMPSGSSSTNGHNYIRVHPDFVAILTSNPEEYAGVFRSQDALTDRMVTINMGYYDEETEVEITHAKSGAAYEYARRIVHLVRKLRESGVCEAAPTLRSSITIAKIVAVQERQLNTVESEFFRQVCIDVLSPKIGNGKKGNLPDSTVVLDPLMQKEAMIGV